VPKLSSRFDEAVAYAREAHADQTRKSAGIPYVSHLLAVAAIALEHGATEDEAIAALLHDTAEDAGGRARLADVRARFGDAVAEIVAGCSDCMEVPKPPWRDRKLAYIEHAETAPPSVLLVSACDKLHNARSTVVELRYEGLSVWGRFKGGKEGTVWYYRRLLEIFRRRELDSRLIAELELAVEELEHFAQSPAAMTGASSSDG
jgi:(p)ppGpp synthase/HD superfamily hydrolase